MCNPVCYFSPLEILNIANKILLESGGQKVIKEVEEDDDYTLREFEGWVQNKEMLQGLVSLYVNNVHMTELMTPVKQVLKTARDVICVKVDGRVMVASGGVARGGQATATKGIAQGQGGYAAGGVFDGRNLRAGKAIGGHGIGTTGSGGEGLGGYANATVAGVKSKGGNSTAGGFIHNQSR